tara:strand:- start:490 stop:1425 length:936 start_codon:yes stop_codon:yes gene_type:complete
MSTEATKTLLTGRDVVKDKWGALLGEALDKALAEEGGMPAKMRGEVVEHLVQPVAAKLPQGVTRDFGLSEAQMRVVAEEAASELEQLIRTYGGHLESGELTMEELLATLRPKIVRDLVEQARGNYAAAEKAYIEKFSGRGRSEKELKEEFARSYGDDGQALHDAANEDLERADEEAARVTEKLEELGPKPPSAPEVEAEAEPEPEPEVEQPQAEPEAAEGEKAGELVANDVEAAKESLGKEGRKFSEKAGEFLKSGKGRLAIAGGLAVGAGAIWMANRGRDAQYATSQETTTSPAQRQVLDEALQGDARQR